jgi:hypothetical protein
MSNTKREGMRRVARGTNPEWARLMLRLVERTAREMQTFTADDVFERYANEIEASRGIARHRAGYGREPGIRSGHDARRQSRLLPAHQHRRTVAPG